MENDTSFARLVSLACHDVRTPLATVHGFARTLTRTVQLEAPADRYVEMIEAASTQIAELLDELSLAARIESGRYDPVARETDSLALARGAAERLGEERVHVSGVPLAHAEQGKQQRSMVLLTLPALGPVFEQREPGDGDAHEDDRRHEREDFGRIHSTPPLITVMTA